MMHHHHHHHHHHNQHHAHAHPRRILSRLGFQFPQDYKLGSGRYSKVYKVFDSQAERYFAIKVTDLERVSDRFKRKFIPRELAVWRALNHPNIVHLHYDFSKRGCLFEIIDLAAGGDMLNYLRNHRRIEEMVCRGWMLQLISGLTYLHQKQIVHRDLKLENILIFEDAVIKISDFGFCKRCDDDDLSSTFCGTTAYKAPELLQTIEYDPFKVDVWALGVVCFVLLTNRMPFNRHTNKAQMVEEQRTRSYRFPSRLGLSEQCRDTIDAVLTFDPDDRPSIFDVHSLPWFEEEYSSD